MENEKNERIGKSLEYRAMVKWRNLASFSFLAVIIILYFGFILTIAIDKSVLYNQLSGGVITIGIPLGVGIIISTVLLSIVFTLTIGKSMDAKKKQILKEIQNENV